MLDTTHSSFEKIIMFAIVITAALFFSAFSARLPLGMKSMKPAINQGMTCSEPSSLITFDDITNVTNSSGVPVPNGYVGLNWENVLVLNGLNDSNPGTGYKAGVVSPPYLVFDGFGGAMAIKSATANTFTINSFYSCAAWYDNITLEITGTKAGSSLYTKSVSLFMQSRTLIELNWSDIDTVNLNSICAWCCDAKHFTMDNLCVTFSK